MATYAYDDFRVSLTPRADGAFDARATNFAGDVVTGTFQLPLSDTELERAILEVAATRGARTRRASMLAATRDVGGTGPPAIDAEQLGRLLAESLLGGEVGAAYERSRRRAEEHRRGLRLSLALGAAPSLLSVPWEFLYRPPRFLASQRRSPLVRVLDAPGVAAPPTVEGAVRVLGVVSSPHDLTPLDVAAERARVDRAVAEMCGLGRVELDWLEPATPGSLRRALRDETYHVVHYVGHSDFTDAGDGVLFLEGDDGASVKVDETLFANLLSDQTMLRLVVLNSCEGARTTLTDPYAGVATTLVRLGVPAVVAMQFEISDAAAIVFAEELYTNLIGRQDPLDSAIGEARKAIYAEVSTVEWATPVLFVSDPEVQLFDFQVVAAPLPSPDPAGMESVKETAVAPPPKPSPPAGRSGKRLVVVAAAALLMALGVVVGVVLASRDDEGATGTLVTTTTATTPPSVATFPSVPVGSEGPIVEVIQRLLNERGFTVEVTGFFDDETEAAVRQFEDSVGAPPDGLVGRVTWQQLVLPLRRGDRGEAVHALQVLLNENGISTEPDGRYTLAIQDQIVALQRANGLGVDGIADIDTWRTLLAGAAANQS